jgi:hypothetical protein
VNGQGPFCPGCGEHHDTEPEGAQFTEGPFIIALFIRPDGEWAVHTTMDRLETLAHLNRVAREAAADLS